MANRPLTGKVALVTASSRFTGAVIAQTLCRAGAQTAVHYHTSKTDSLAKRFIASR